MKRRVAELPLHRGRAPRWLFERMTRLAGAVTMAVVDEYGPGEMLRRLSDPWWFQAFGCVLGFDWHSSGLTTVTCGALKEAYRRRGADLGLIVAGGKGAASRRTPREIAEGADDHAVAGGERLIRASRMSARVDSSAVQDGHQVYHHAFFFLPDGGWCVVQQGMDGEAGRARRYHWLGDEVDDFVCEPHAAMRDLGGRSEGAQGVLDLSDRASGANREACAELARTDPDRVPDPLRPGPAPDAPRGRRRRSPPAGAPGRPRAASERLRDPARHTGGRPEGGPQPVAARRGRPRRLALAGGPGPEMGGLRPRPRRQGRHAPTRGPGGLRPKRRGAPGRGAAGPAGRPPQVRSAEAACRVGGLGARRRWTERRTR